MTYGDVAYGGVTSVSIHLHTFSYISIRQYISIHPHTWHAGVMPYGGFTYGGVATSLYVSIRLHTSPYIILGMTHKCHPNQRKCQYKNVNTLDYLWWCHVWISHVTPGWVMAHTCEYVRTHCKNESWHTCMIYVSQINEKSHTWMRKVTHEWVMSQWVLTYSSHVGDMTHPCVTFLIHVWPLLIETWLIHVWLIHVWCDMATGLVLAHMNVSCCFTHGWETSHMSEKCHTYEWKISHINESCHTCEWVMSHTWMISASHMNEECHIWMRNITHEWEMSHMNEKCRTWMRNITHEWEMSHMNEECHTWMRNVTHEWEISHTDKSRHKWISRTTHEYVMPHMNESCHIWMGHITYEWVTTRM